MLPIRFAATLLLTFPIFAADAPLPDLHTDAAAGGSIFTVKYNYTQPLAAFVIELVDYPAGIPFSLPHDEMGANAIPAGGEKKINVTNITVGTVPEHVKLLAAVYEDGATAGAPDKIKEILDRRKARLDTTREIIQRIQKAQGAGKDKDAIVAELREWSNSMAPPRSIHPVAVDLNKAAIRTLVGVAASHINTQGMDAELINLKKAETELAASKPPL